jgi:hypothetical protein
MKIELDVFGDAPKWSNNKEKILILTKTCCQIVANISKNVVMTPAKTLTLLKQNHDKFRSSIVVVLKMFFI